MCVFALLVKLPLVEISRIFLGGQGNPVANALSTPHNFGLLLDVEHGTECNGRH
jgi:hypothetical protein